MHCVRVWCDWKKRLARAIVIMHKLRRITPSSSLCFFSIVDFSFCWLFSRCVCVCCSVDCGDFVLFGIDFFVQRWKTQLNIYVYTGAIENWIRILHLIGVWYFQLLLAIFIFTTLIRLHCLVEWTRGENFKAWQLHLFSCKIWYNFIKVYKLVIFRYNRLIPTNSDTKKYVLDEFFFVHYTSSTSSLYQFDELYHFMKKKQTHIVLQHVRALSMDVPISLDQHFLYLLTAHSDYAPNWRSISWENAVSINNNRIIEMDVWIRIWISAMPSSHTNSHTQSNVYGWE